MNFNVEQVKTKHAKAKRVRLYMTKLDTMPQK